LRDRNKTIIIGGFDDGKGLLLKKITKGLKE